MSSVSAVIVLLTKVFPKKYTTTEELSKLVLEYAAKVRVTSNRFLASYTPTGMSKHNQIYEYHRHRKHFEGEGAKVL